MFKVTFSNKKVKRFKGELQKAYTRGDLRSIWRLSVLIMICERRDMETIRTSWDVSVSTVLPLVESLCGGRLEKFGLWENAKPVVSLEQNAKAPTAGLAQSGTGKVWLSDRLLDQCIDPGSDLPEVSYDVQPFLRV
jgi:hypothetical protein